MISCGLEHHVVSISLPGAGLLFFPVLALPKACAASVLLPALPMCGVVAGAGAAGAAVGMSTWGATKLLEMGKAQSEDFSIEAGQRRLLL